jgi:hypothetical protein
MFVTVCFFKVEDIFLLESKGQGGGGGASAPFTGFIYLHYFNFKLGHYNTRCRNMYTKSTTTQCVLVHNLL